MLDARTTRNARMLIDEGARILRGSEIAPPEYSIIRAISDLVDNSGKVGSLSTPEVRASKREAERLGVPPNPGCLYVPVQQRDASVSGTASYLTGTSTAPGDTFISALRAYSVANALGVTELNVPNFNVSLPSVGTDITTYWLSDETTQINEGNLVFGQTATVPKSVGAYFEISHLLLKQITPAAERFIMAEAGKAVAAAVDAALIQGSGSSGQPTGLLSAGIGSETGTSLTWATTASAINDVEASGGMVNDASGGWAIAPDAAELLRVRDSATNAGKFILQNGMVDGRKAVVSGSVPTGTAIFGDWSQVVIASWGALEIGIAKSAASTTLFTTGRVGVRCLWTIDIMVLHAPSFSAISSIT